MSFNQQFEKAIQQAWKANIARVKHIAEAIMNGSAASESHTKTPYMRPFVKDCKDLSTKIDNACARTGGIICRNQTLKSIWS
jgi:hypothetical protein